MALRASVDRLECHCALGEEFHVVLLEVFHMQADVLHLETVFAVSDAIAILVELEIDMVAKPFLCRMDEGKELGVVATAVLAEGIRAGILILAKEVNPS